MSRRVVITGCAAITPIGNTKEGIVKHLTEGLSGVKAMRADGLLTEHIHSGVFGSVDYP
ncbi:MAG: 3-oxoacyl-ACP synthase, partial [Desulfobacterales bacterium]|nr:3-oxoacyl-ACP synthase [Desulfobacterales bacterium]